MQKAVTITITLLVMATTFLGTGCATGLVMNPDLSELAYDRNGVLQYRGQRVEGIKLALPWYEEMWPDNPPEWGFAIVTMGLTAAVAGSGGGGDGQPASSTTDEPITVATSPVSAPSSGNDDASEEVITVTTGGDSGGGGGGGGSPAPPSGGGDELPF
ncbi:MAG: hypothetical protein A2498_14870 [Lentisphaerae bacterium RIFOXYC12_FULL_60_16]|nr:MAG: hypothetical protein A2498_14870 [Lentisphaerae bacterium RIFOXYC12_FULL_60_16]OGV75091.1 MAG: hypothetical protein A2269_08520 [Lentisphaerae bacterium RIFOXYA12_FULL_60_10]